MVPYQGTSRDIYKIRTSFAAIAYVLCTVRNYTVDGDKCDKLFESDNQVHRVTAICRGLCRFGKGYNDGGKLHIRWDMSLLCYLSYGL